MPYKAIRKQRAPRKYVKKGGNSGKADGMYKEKIKFMQEVTVKVVPGQNGVAFLNIHHTHPFTQDIGTVTPGNVVFNGAQQHQFNQLGAIFQKYAVYGLNIKIQPKEYFPEAAGTANVRGISSGTMTDTQNIAAAGQPPNIVWQSSPVTQEQLLNQGDYRSDLARGEFSRYYKVGANTKRTGGEYWYSCSEFKDSTTNSVLTFPSLQANRVTCFTWDLGPGFTDGSYLANAEITYYVMFKQRKYALR